ncbi:hypothetical protein OH76DRAFT_1488174 [Lentinus brumalis]|uniref:C2H2-type domain-containing protein n=1 Tax=Lentinus brumalis TaxID=2498619 RepID=A0A371CS06_9APHY|nr:hypothetical protein OH76DRAFT_1488174 [Polyporus brumalis]
MASYDSYDSYAPEAYYLGQDGRDLTEMLQDWLDAEHMRRFLPEDEWQERPFIYPSAPSPRTPSPSASTTPLSSPPTPEDNPSTPSESRGLSPVSGPDTMEDDDDYSISSDSESRASSPTSEHEEPEWLPVTTVIRYTWAGQLLPSMTADHLWDYLKKKGVLKNSRNDGRVKCEWPGCGEFRPRNDLRRHVRFQHQRIKKCCTNPGCGAVEREDNFMWRHATCEYGDSGAFILLIAPPE